MLNPELEKELREWLRPVSALTAFAKSVRGEGATEGKGADPNPDASKVADNPLKDVDLTELPTDVRTRIEEANLLIAKSQTEKQQLELKHQNTEKFAREQQSRADRAESIVKSHNLPVNGQQQQQVSTDPLQSKIDAATNRFVAQGMDEKTAKVYGKMFAMEALEQEKEILGKLGGLVGTVGNMQADTHLSSAKSEFAGVFKIPELEKQIQDNVRNLVQNGRPVDKVTVDHLVSMAWGQYTLKNPDAMKLNQQQQQQIPQFGSGIGSGVHLNNPNPNPNNQTPTATQPETVQIMNAVVAEMNRGLPKKK